MKLLALAPAGAVAALAIWLLAPLNSLAFTIIGPPLGLDQRDVRVFDNFADPAANDNTTLHPDFPGFTGVEVAIWKAVVEWGSLSHGSGGGDPTQPNLGDGCANFDPTWQGNAAGPGGVGDNVFSALANCGGGLLAFTEVSPGGGWRIRFCDELAWDDGPGADLLGFDVQGTAVHEYGHALGLGHSTIGAASMAPSSSGGISERSIHADDIAGVQFLYGPKAAGKPRIDAVLVGPAEVRIEGANFAPTGNAVWFPNVGGDGTPRIVSGLVATAGGTLLQLPIPTGSGPGDVLVRVPGSDGAALSNAFPFDPAGEDAVAYCVGKTNSLGCIPSMSSTGLPSATDPAPFRLIGSQVVPDEFGILLYGTNGRSNLAFHNGRLCVKAPLTRLLPPKNSGSTGTPPCSGVLRSNFNARIQSGSDPSLAVGERVNAQWIYRDPGVDAFGDGLTAAAEFFINP